MARAGCAQAVCMECVPPTECAGVRHREGLTRHSGRESSTTTCAMWRWVSDLGFMH